MAESWAVRVLGRKLVFLKVSRFELPDSEGVSFECLLSCSTVLLRFCDAPCRRGISSCLASRARRRTHSASFSPLVCLGLLALPTFLPLTATADPSPSELLITIAPNSRASGRRSGVGAMGRFEVGNESVKQGL
jgi:hypothetical protein